MRSSDFDKDLAEDAEKIIQVLGELQPILSVLFPSQPRNFALQHRDLSLSNILVDSATYQIMAIVDWESVGTRPHWEDIYPQFLLGPEITEEIEPLAPGDTDVCRVECWENWEKMKLRLVFDRELDEAYHDNDGRDEIRREFRKQLDLVEISPGYPRKWMKENFHPHIVTGCDLGVSERRKSLTSLTCFSQPIPTTSEDDKDQEPENDGKILRPIYHTPNLQHTKDLGVKFTREAWPTHHPEA